MTPFRALYGRDPPTILSYMEGIAGSSQLNQQLLERDELLRVLKRNLQHAQQRMKTQADRHRRELQLEEGSWAFVRLRPYRQLKPCKGHPDQQITPLPLLREDFTADMAPANLEDKVVLQGGSNVTNASVNQEMQGGEDGNADASVIQEMQGPLLIVKWDAYALFLTSRNRGNRFGRSKRGIGSSEKIASLGKARRQGGSSITFVQVRVSIPLLLIHLASILGEGYRYPSSPLELGYRYWLPSTDTSCLKTVFGTP
ncbi:hypothetical protein GQ457_04G013090 [Hibiscus cannabinus]